LIALISVLAGSLNAAETNEQADAIVNLVVRLVNSQSQEAPLYITHHENRMPVLMMEAIESEATRRYLPKATIYRMVASNDPIHRAIFSCLIIDKSRTPHHLQTDQEVLNYIGDLASEVQNKNDALQLIRLFAELRSYRIVLSPPGGKDCRKPEDRPKPSPFDYTFSAEDSDKYRIHATLMTDAYSGSHVRFTFTLNKESRSGVDVEEKSLIHVRNYVR
jgi:hypothetical protein